MLTGEFVQQETDLFIHGPSALVHSRIYDSGMSNAASPIGYGFTRAIPREIRHERHYKEKSKDDEGNWVDGGTNVATVQEREGVPLVYYGHHNGRSDEEGGQDYGVRSSVFNRGYTNYSPGEISGRTNLHNVRLLHKGYKKHEK